MSDPDVIVIGGGMGGLSAAIHCRLKGMNVLLLEKGAALGGKAAQIHASGFTFDPGPSILILPWVYENVFEAANKPMRDYLRFHPLDPISRVYTENGQFLDLPASRLALIELIQREAPQDAAAFERFLAICDRFYPLVKSSVFAKPYLKPADLLDLNLIKTAFVLNTRIPYKRLIDDWFKTDLLRAFFYGFPSYSGNSYRLPAPGALLIPYLMIEEGVYYPEGGVAAIPRAFTRLAEELGVQFQLDSEITQFITENKRVKAVKLKSGQILTANAFISNLDRLSAQKLLGNAPDLPASFSYFTLQWGLKRKMPGLKHHTLLVPANYPQAFQTLYDQRSMPQRPVLYLNAPSVIDPHCAPPQCENLFLVISSPGIEPHFDWNERQNEFRQDALKLMRDFNFELNESDIAFERMQTPIYFQQTHGNYKGSLYGPDEKHRFYGMFPLSNRDDRLSNLFYAGGSVQPGAGLPMVTLSGQFAADLASRT